MTKTPSMHLPGPKTQAYIDARIKDIEVAAQRSRWVYIALLTVSWLLISVTYSSTWSWARTMATAAENTWNSDVQAGPRGHLEKCGKEYTVECIEGLHSKYGLDDRNPVDWMRKQYLEAWTDSLFFDLPIIGARFSAPDSGIIGGVALLLLGVWSFFTARRENHLVYYLVRDVINWDWGAPAKGYVRLQLAATQIFTSGWHDKAFYARHIKSPDLSKAKSKGHGDPVMRTLLFGMFALPVIALLFVLFSDLQTLDMDSPFRRGPETLREVIAGSCAAGADSCKAMDDLWTRLGISILFVVLQAFVVWRGYRFQRGTSELIAVTRDWKIPKTRAAAGNPT